jgi:hypothetical protein
MTTDRNARPRSRPLAQDRDPWEKMPGESGKSYAAFVVYRTQSPHRRSLRVLARELGKSRAIVERWSGSWQWQFRVEQWDQAQENERLADLRDQQKQERENWLGLAHGLMQIGGKRLADLKAEDLNPSQASIFIARGVAIARAALAPIPDKTAAGGGMDSLLNDLEGATIIADGTEEQFIGAIREALKREGRLPTSDGEEKPPRSV